MTIEISTEFDADRSCFFVEAKEGGTTILEHVSVKELTNNHLALARAEIEARYRMEKYISSGERAKDREQTKTCLDKFFAERRKPCPQ